MASLLRYSLLVALPLMAMAATACLDDGTCDAAASSSDEKGHALLQIHQGQVSRTRGGPAEQLLPPELFKLGVELLGSEQTLDELVSNSRPENIVYGGVPLVLRMVSGDGSDGTLRGEGLELYGLDSLDEVRQRPPVQHLINMLDVGGNYGAVTIAAFKKFPTLLRAVVVEPIPSTYFFIRWNMHLNGVPALDEAQLKATATNTTGVLALNKAVVSSNRDSIDTCYTPPYTMNAFICNCKDPSTWPDPEKTKCQKIGGATMNGLVDLFGGAPITIAKVDCEGCEMVGFEQLHTIIKAEPGRLRRLVGELHHPSRDVENVACMFEGGKYFVRLCAFEEDLHKPVALECGANPTPCQKDPAATILLNNILRDSSGDEGA